jgi:membrane-bound ClpP family serine protease
MAAKGDDLTSSNSFVESELTKKLIDLEDHFGSDVITIIAPMRTGIDDLTRAEIEDISNRKDKLLVILETEGGSIEVVERIANLLRYHYPNEVAFLVPNFAMSAGTVLVMSGDRILMDYFSVLGPIDPQVKSRSKGDVFVPALGYLEKYNHFIDEARNGNLSAAEIAFFVQKFDPAELHQFEQARELTIELLEQWLAKFKFKNWVRTQTTGRTVTEADKKARAAEIATKLNDTGKWKSHARGLSMEVVTNELNLRVEDFGAEPELNGRVRSYHRLLQDYMIRVRQSCVLHTRERYLGFWVSA